MQSRAKTLLHVLSYEVLHTCILKLCFPHIPSLISTSSFLFLSFTYPGPSLPFLYTQSKLSQSTWKYNRTKSTLNSLSPPQPQPHIHLAKDSQLAKSTYTYLTISRHFQHNPPITTRKSIDKTTITGPELPLNLASLQHPIQGSHLSKIPFPCFIQRGIMRIEGQEIIILYSRSINEQAGYFTAEIKGKRW